MTDVVLFGCKDTSLVMARHLKSEFESIRINLVTISPETATKNRVAGYVDLTKHSALFSAIFIAGNYSLSDLEPDEISGLTRSNFGLCIGWQRLIPARLLQRFKTGVFGMHGSARDLPFGKGRSPMNWAILEGRQSFHTNLFKYEAGIDNGPILDSSTFSITSHDTAETLHFKNTLSMFRLVKRNYESLVSGKIQLREQARLGGESFYPKRTKNDGLIDWRDDIHNIERLIRAVSAPFHGAFSFLQQNRFVIERASIFYTDLEDHPYRLSCPGEVLAVFENQKFLVRCSGGVLIIHEFEGVAPKIGMIFQESLSPFLKFDRNEYGFFDI